MSTCSQDPLGSGQYVFGCTRWLDPDDPRDVELLATGFDDFQRDHALLKPALSFDRLVTVLRRVVSIWRGTGSRSASLSASPCISAASSSQRCFNLPAGQTRLSMLACPENGSTRCNQGVPRIAAFEQQARTAHPAPSAPPPAASPAQDQADASSAPPLEAYSRPCPTPPCSKAASGPYPQPTPLLCGRSASPGAPSVWSRAGSEPDIPGADFLDPFDADGGTGESAAVPAYGAAVDEWAADLPPAGDPDAPWCTFDALLPRLLHPWP